jgi:hypothetical protein
MRWLPHIAYYIGQFAALDTGAYFHFFSKDTGSTLDQHEVKKKSSPGGCRIFRHSLAGRRNLSVTQRAGGSLCYKAKATEGHKAPPNGQMVFEGVDGACSEGSSLMLMWHGYFLPC